MSSTPRHSSGRFSRNKHGRDFLSDSEGDFSDTDSVQSYRGSARNSNRGDFILSLGSAQRNSGRVVGNPDVNYAGATPARTPRQVSFVDTPGTTPRHEPLRQQAPPSLLTSGSASSSSSGSTADKSKPVFTNNCLLAATATPMLANGDVDFDSIPMYADALKADGVDGVFCNGTAGEAVSLSVRERCRITEMWVQSGVRVCTHIGAQALPDVCEMAAHAQRVGADAIAVMIPHYYKPLSVNEYVDFLAEVSAAAPRIPMLVYHFPAITGVNFKLYDIIVAAQKRGTVPNLRGAKFTNLDLADYMACRTLPGVTDMIYSHEQNMLAAAFMGATAFVGLQFSVVGPLYKRIAAAGSAGKQTEGQALQKLAAQYMNMFNSCVGGSLEKFVAGHKYLLSLRLQRDCGETRPPGARLSVQEADKLKAGFLDYVKSYSSAVKSLGGSSSSSSAAPPKPINVKAMDGYKGRLDDKITARINEISRRIGVSNLKSYFPHLNQPNWRRPQPDENTNAAQFIDHTILKPEATRAEVTKLCDEAKKHNFYAVCVNGSRVEQCLEELQGSRVHVAAVIGFPLGAGTIAAHAKEARELVARGVDEIDMVMNIGHFKDGDYQYVFEDIQAVVQASAPAIVKVIFETCLLNQQETIDACILSVAAGAHYVKTSTGFNKGGATPEAIDVMLACVGNEALVKASGGVRDAKAAGAYISAGVKRIGTSSGVAIVSGQKSSGY